MKRTLIIIVLVYSLIMASCSGAQIDRAISILSGVPAIVTALHLANESQVLNALSEITTAIKVFRDNPTRSNYKNALEVIDGLLRSNVFHVNAALLATILAIENILSSIIPVGSAQRVGSPNDKVSPKAILKSDVDRLEAKVKELKESVKK